MATGTELITLDQVQDALLNGAVLDVVDPDAVQVDMVRRILEAEDVREAFAGFSATNAQEIEGMLVDVVGIAWMRSAYEEGSPVYALLQVIGREDKIQRTVSMGGKTLCASFLWAQRNEAMPITGTFRRDQSNSNPERKFWVFVLPPVSG